MENFTETRRRQLTLRIQKASEKTAAGCWLWRRALDSDGYENVGIEDKTYKAHRLSFELACGPIPHGVTLDHLCRNRACVNPSHLEPVSLRQNILRGTSFAAKNAVKTHCKNGHEFTPSNTLIRRSKHRGCRLCGLLASARYRANKRAVPGVSVTA